jgi:hypothetical protein
MVKSRLLGAVGIVAVVGGIPVGVAAQRPARLANITDAATAATMPTMTLLRKSIMN